MWRKLASFGLIVVLFWLSSPLAVAQEDERYDFDGMAYMDPQPADPTDWMTPENWGDGGFDPLDPLLPDFGTRVEIDNEHYGENAPVIGPGDAAQAFGVRIGRTNGPGELTMTGGTLDLVDRCANFGPCDSRLRVGAAQTENPDERNPGTFNLSGGTVTTDTLWIGSGSYGEMNMSDGVVTTRGDLSMDWTFDASSHFSLTGGVVNVGRWLRMYRNSSLEIDGGMMFVTNFAGLGYTDTAVTQTPNVTVNINSGLLESGSFLRVNGSVVVDGGILRAFSFDETDSAGTVEINGSGLLQFENSQESVAAVQGLITSGFFTTSEASPLIVEIVDVEGVNFTQVSAAALGLPGDYNENGIVDAADYTIWRDTLGSTSDLRANGDNTGGSMGVIDQADYDFWKAKFGNTSGSGSGSVLDAAAVPEPAAFVFGLMALAGAALMRRPA